MLTEKTYYTGRYDRIFKKVFINEDDPRLLKEFLTRLLGRKIEEIKFLREELPITSSEDKVKTVDMLVRIDNEYLHLELNCNDSTYYHVRNYIFFTSVYNRKVKRKENYDSKIKFIHIDLTYGMSKNKALKSVYYVQDEVGNKYVDNIEIIEYNMDKYKEFWYNKNEIEIEKYKHLIMLDLSKEELKKISIGDNFMKEYEKEVNEVNEQETYERFISPEEDAKMILNTEKSISFDEGMEKGIEKGLEQGLEQGSLNSKYEIAKNFLNKGIDIELISECTNLSIEEINNLKDA